MFHSSDGQAIEDVRAVLRLKDADPIPALNPSKFMLTV